jgi:cell division protein FtsL
MNLLGKIFVVLIFVMSLVFATFAIGVYATHQNWKAKAASLKTTIDERNTELEARKADIEKLNAEIEKEAVAKREALAKLETERVELAKDHDNLTKERDALLAQRQQAVAALDTAQQNLAKLTTEVNTLRDEIREAQARRDKSFDEVVRLTDQIHQARGELKRLSERDVQLAGQLAKAEGVLKMNDLSKDMPLDGRPPLARGKVLAINRDDMIEISLGSDDGLRAGHTLEVFRASRYLGKVEVLTTSNDRAVGKIIPGFKKGAIQRGDDVATRFTAA